VNPRTDRTWLIESYCCGRQRFYPPGRCAVIRASDSALTGAGPVRAERAAARIHRSAGQVGLGFVPRARTFAHRPRGVVPGPSRTAHDLPVPALRATLLQAVRVRVSGAVPSAARAATPWVAKSDKLGWSLTALRPGAVGVLQH
jgi:hypothetical protein